MIIGILTTVNMAVRIWKRTTRITLDLYAERYVRNLL